MTQRRRPRIFRTLTTDAGDNPYIRRPPPIESPPIPPKSPPTTEET